MTHSLPESKWKPPPVDSIVRNIDRVYAGGLFWRVVSPQLLERQSRLISAIALMAEKLKASLPSDHSSPESHQRFLTSSSSPQTGQDTLITRHQRELRLFSEAVKRGEKKSMLDLDPTAANIAFVYSRLAASVEFWEDAKFWCGMPWWRNPRLDFPWAPSAQLPETDPPGRQPSVVTNDSHRTVTFCEGEKDSSLKAPAATRVPRCSTPTNSEFSVVRALRPKVKLVSV